LEDILDLGLTFRGSEAVYTFELLQNEPNPFNGSTQIGYVIPENGQVILTLFDLTGRELYKQTVLGNKGMNTVEVQKDRIGAQGVVYYQVQFQGYTATKKLSFFEPAFNNKNYCFWDPSPRKWRGFFLIASPPGKIVFKNESISLPRNGQDHGYRLWFKQDGHLCDRSIGES
jgi:hypothetical protein